MQVCQNTEPRKHSLHRWWRKAVAELCDVMQAPDGEDLHAAWPVLSLSTTRTKDVRMINSLQNLGEEHCDFFCRSELSNFSLVVSLIMQAYWLLLYMQDGATCWKQPEPSWAKVERLVSNKSEVPWYPSTTTCWISFLGSMLYSMFTEFKAEIRQ